MGHKTYIVHYVRHPLYFLKAFSTLERAERFCDRFNITRKSIVECTTDDEETIDTLMGMKP
jgi:hypothetical protein